ncbi:MAG: type II CAAX endopeptidase family protein [Nanoarchaeota archaeon]
MIPIILLLLAQVLFGYGQSRLFMWATQLGLPAHEPTYELFGVIIFAALVGALLLFRKPKEIGLTSGEKALPAALWGLALLFPVALFSRIVDPGFDAWYAQQFGLTDIGALLGLVALMPVIVLKEELFLRPLTQSELTRRAGKVLAILALSLNFALFHLTYLSALHDVSIFVTVFLGSVIMALAYERTKSILAPLLIHLCYNVLLCFQTFWHANGFATQEYLFWGCFAILFAFMARPAFRGFLPILKERPRLSWAFLLLLLFAALPLAFRFLF